MKLSQSPGKMIWANSLEFGEVLSAIFSKNALNSWWPGDPITRLNIRELWRPHQLSLWTSKREILKTNSDYISCYDSELHVYVVLCTSCLQQTVVLMKYYLWYSTGIRCNSKHLAFFIRFYVWEKHILCIKRSVNWWRKISSSPDEIRNRSYISYDDIEGDSDRWSTCSGCTNQQI